MENLLEKTLAMIVKENSKAASVFEKYELDFCCKGKRTLLTACEQKGLNARGVEADLKTVLASDTTETFGFPFEKLPPADLCDYIVKTHHHYVREELPRILSYAQKVATKHGDRYPYLKELLLLAEELHNELMPHLLKEETVLFPLIKKLDTPKAGITESLGAEKRFIKNPIAVMEREHDRASELMAAIRHITDQYQAPPGACTTFRLLYDSLHRFEMDLHKHVHLENNVLFQQYE